MSLKSAKALLTSILTIIILLLFTNHGVCSDNGIDIIMKDGRTLHWKSYVETSARYCKGTLKSSESVCVFKINIASIKLVKSKKKVSKRKKKDGKMPSDPNAVTHGKTKSKTMIIPQSSVASTSHGKTESKTTIIPQKVHRWPYYIEPPTDAADIEAEDKYIEKHRRIREKDNLILTKQTEEFMRQTHRKETLNARGLTRWAKYDCDPCLFNIYLRPTNREDRLKEDSYVAKYCYRCTDLGKRDMRRSYRRRRIETDPILNQCKMTMDAQGINSVWTDLAQAREREADPYQAIVKENRDRWYGCREGCKASFRERDKDGRLDKEGRQIYWVCQACIDGCISKCDQVSRTDSRWPRAKRQIEKIVRKYKEIANKIKCERGFCPCTRDDFDYSEEQRRKQKWKRESIIKDLH